LIVHRSAGNVNIFPAKNNSRIFLMRAVWMEGEIPCNPTFCTPEQLKTGAKREGVWGFGLPNWPGNE